MFPIVQFYANRSVAWGWCCFGLVFLLRFFSSAALAVDERTPPPFAEDRLANTFGFIHWGTWSQVAPGVEVRTVTLSRDGQPTRVELVLVRLNLEQTRLRILESRRYGEPGLGVADFLRQSESLFAINASYFDEQSQPLGYLWDGSLELNGKPERGGAFSGVLRISGKTAAILHRRDYDRETGDLALQAGPRILVDGEPPSSLKHPVRVDRRSGVAVQADGRPIFFATQIRMAAFKGAILPKGDGMSFRELALLFGKDGHEHDIAAPNVLNFDGGTSAGLAVQVGATSVAVPNFVPVPVALAASGLKEEPENVDSSDETAANDPPQPEERTSIQGLVP